MFRVSEYRARSALPLATEGTQETRLSSVEREKHRRSQYFDYNATFPMPFISSATCTPRARNARIRARAKTAENTSPNVIGSGRCVRYQIDINQVGFTEMLKIYRKV